MGLKNPTVSTSLPEDVGKRDLKMCHVIRIIKEQFRILELLDERIDILEEATELREDRYVKDMKNVSEFMRGTTRIINIIMMLIQDMPTSHDSRFELGLATAESTRSGSEDRESLSSITAQQ